MSIALERDPGYVLTIITVRGRPAQLTMRSDLDSLIRQRVEAFTKDLQDLVRQAALASVQETFGVTQSKPSPRRTQPSTPTAPRASKKRRGRRAVAGSEELGEGLESMLRATPGQAMEELTAALGHKSATLRPILARLIEAGSVRKEGQKRGTKYYPA